MDPFKLIRIFGILGYFVRELIYDRKDITDFKDPRFNSRKFGILIVIKISIFVNLFLLYRLIAISSELRELKEEHVQLHQYVETELRKIDKSSHIEMKIVNKQTDSPSKK